jgi:ABC-type branched-subunit amino acid transport system ATPase component
MALQIADRGCIETGAIVMSDRADSLRENPNVQKSYLGIT